jgi:cysteine-S-conjugate beta-lyase
MTHNFDDLPDRRATESSKWNAYEEHVLPMWVADMDFASPPADIEALSNRVAHGVFGYPRYLSELRELIVKRLATLYNWQVRPGELVFLPGVVTGFNLACHMFVSEGGSVVTQPPVYPPILSAPENAGLVHRDAPLMQSESGRYEFDWVLLLKEALNDQTRLFILCNPHNPTGRVFQKDELERLAEACLKNDTIICADEIHSDLVYSGHQHIPIATLHPEIASRTITLMAPSKTFNLAGLQCSFAVIQNAELRQRFQNAGKGLVSWVNLMGLTAALAAYREGQPWLRELLLYLENNRDEVVRLIKANMPGMEIYAPEATYLAWLDCRRLDLPDGPYQFFLKQAHVALGDGKTFGRGGEGFVRLNFGCPRVMLIEALERMQVALEQCHHLSSMEPTDGH